MLNVIVQNNRYYVPDPATLVILGIKYRERFFAENKGLIAPEQ